MRLVHAMHSNGPLPQVANCLLQINSDVLTDIIERMTKGERVKGDSQEEKDCLQLIHDLDHIGGHVKGSITSKKIHEK